MIKKTHIIAVLFALTLGACNTTSEQTGTIIGAGAGGLLGSTVGSGSGRLYATAIGAVVGALSGQSIGRHVDEHHQDVVILHYDGSCDMYANEGARSACQIGAAKRARELQRHIESQAFIRGYNGVLR